MKQYLLCNTLYVIMSDDYMCKAHQEFTRYSPWLEFFCTQWVWDIFNRVTQTVSKVISRINAPGESIEDLDYLGQCRSQTKRPTKAGGSC